MVAFIFLVPDAAARAILQRIATKWLIKIKTSSHDHPGKVALAPRRMNAQFQRQPSSAEASPAFIRIPIPETGGRRFTAPQIPGKPMAR
ncbi:MAG: hypothetical protein U1F77_05215 [Kiritimatiellia bacterium]